MLKDRIKELGINEGINKTGIQGIEIFKISTAFSKINTILPASICIISQGSKNLYLGEEKYTYNENSYLIGTIKMPVKSELINSSPENPCLGIIINLDVNIITELLKIFDELKDWQYEKKSKQIITISPMNKAIENSLERLLNISSNQMDIKVLSKSFIREFFYEILKTPQGHILRNSVQHHTKVHEMVPTIKYLEQNFQNDITIDEIAKFASMSVATLHKNFKKATSLSPIQFIKQLRLHNAHSLLMSGYNASNAAFESGYTNSAQFSREFKRLFTYSPRDIKNI
ncbi:transcriptional regulator, AraC family [Arcobacter acticola]|jgi:AraC-like DNA-binding protein|uniref:Transcriptional regulator, AraC family n=1 Tax=Arcobacter acticola TaxID=1849015 RepID=A0A6M8EBJ5_9BACT|nr:AraC family transcriptional regulator [Arcobacter acticola]QKE27800.1 transcriptional regulator, AraC family [Arcobacter acticola]